MRRTSSTTARLILASAVSVLALALTACAGGASTPAATAPDAASSSAAALSGTVTVSAAASLTGTYTTLGKQFEAAHPGVKVTFNFGASSDLANQINAGAPVDVFASANQATMDTVTKAQPAGATPLKPTVYATNTLVIVVPKGNPAHITGLKDFADEKKTIAVCAKEVPCGAAADTVFTAAHITPKPDTLEKDVKAALTKVELDEVDAALVYKTDALSSTKVDRIDFPEASSAVNAYPIVLLPTKNAAAAAFVDYVLSDDAKQVFEQAGFNVA